MKDPRRLAEIAFVVPWIGVFLLTPPVILVVQNWSLASGLPLFHIYLFACWAILIAVARRLSVWLSAEEDKAGLPPAPSIERPD